jgi:hypothetical protein
MDSLKLLDRLMDRTGTQHLVNMRVTDPSFLEDQIFQNFFVYTVQDTEAMVSLYRLARSESEDLIKLINGQLET